MSKQYKLIRCNINGKDVEKMVDVRASLTDMLRNDYHLTSVKKGCEVGECGACTVLIDGETFNSCIYLAVWADGKHIRTLEGLLSPDGEPSDIQQAFMEESAIQCGFCTPGFLMTAVEILDSGKLYSDAELRKLLSGHLCRCTGYVKIIDAILLAAEIFAAGEVPPPPTDYSLGSRVPRIDVEEKVTGTGIYPDDVYLEGMLYASALRSRYPRARVLDIRTDKARALPGVEAVFTALALQEGFVPPTVGYQVPDPACYLDIVPNEGRKADLKIALSNSLGFGGHNAAIVLKKWED